MASGGGGVLIVAVAAKYAWLPLVNKWERCSRLGISAMRS